METNGTQSGETTDAPKLFVGQVPKTMTQEELNAVFAPYGELKEVFIIRDKATGAHRGCCFVTYSKKAEADAAIAGLHNVKTLPPYNNPMQVKYAEGEQERLEHKLFVGMVPKSASEADLRPLFEPYGTIEELTILRQGGESKGCGFVKYTQRSEALAAISSLNGTAKMQDSIQPLVVKFAETQKQKDSKRQQMMMQQQQMYGMMPGGYGAPPAGPYGGYPPQGPGMYGNAGLGAADPSHFGAANPYLAAGLPYGMPGMNAAPGLPMQAAGGAAAAAAAAAVAAGQQEGPPGANLFIYHLPIEFGDRDLAVIFAPFGNIVSSKVFVDRVTGQSKCFGFVSYDNAESANNAIAQMHGFQVGSKRLKVQVKKPKNKPY